MTQRTQAIEHLNPIMLNAFIDGELPASEQQGIQQHLIGCHACTLRVLSATQLKAATARAGQRFAPPPEALARLSAPASFAVADNRANIRSIRTLFVLYSGQPSPQPSC